MQALTFSSPGKVNLLLDVLRRRPDGYHDISSLMVKVGLCDTLTVAEAPAGEVTITCDDPTVPVDAGNLVHAAVECVRQEAGLDRGCAVDIEADSSRGRHGRGKQQCRDGDDCARQLWGLDWPRSRLQDLGKKIGADVPFFFGASTSIVSQTGTTCTGADLRWRGWLVLVSASVSVPTGPVYARCRPQKRHDAPERIEQLLAAGDARTMGSLMHNDLEAAVFEVAPQVRALRERVVAEGARVVRVSGAGSTLMEPFDEQQAAEAFAARLRALDGVQRVCVVEAPQGDASPVD